MFHYMLFSSTLLPKVHQFQPFSSSYSSPSQKLLTFFLLHSIPAIHREKLNKLRWTGLWRDQKSCICLNWFLQSQSSCKYWCYSSWSRKLRGLLSQNFCLKWDKLFLLFHLFTQFQKIMVILEQYVLCFQL